MEHLDELELQTIELRKAMVREIKNTQKDIRLQSTILKNQSDKLHSLIKLQNNQLNDYKKEYPFNFIKNLSKILNLSIVNTNNLFKDYKELSTSIINKRFFELIGVIGKPDRLRKNITGVKRPKKTLLITVGSTISQLKKLIKSAKTHNEITIIQEMIKGIKDEL